jgi:hypothetical protein
MNKAAIERGLFDGCKFTFYKTEFLQKEELGNPDASKTDNPKSANYNKLVNGIVQKGQHIETGDVLIGAYMPIPKGKDDKFIYIDRSIVYKDQEDAIVHNVIKDQNEDDNPFVKVSLRKIRPVSVGDKFCVTGQHEVLTLEGWKNIKNVTVNDIVATLNHEKLEWHHPIKKYSFDHCGEMYNVDNDYISLETTLNHKMYVKINNIYKLIEARHIIDKNVQFKRDCKAIEVIQTTDSQIKAILEGKTADIKNNQVIISEFNKQPYAKGHSKYYDGVVYCLEVPNNIFMVRKNNKYCWTGNSSRSGQKGICSINMREADFPTTIDGIRPTALFNPSGIPSRMTMAQLIESLLSIICAIKGTFYDATMFKTVDIDSISSELEKYGFNKFGYERMINGMSGEFIDSVVYFGPTFYQRLQKFVADAEYSVRHALTDAITFQPLDGQGSSGGLKVGEMEKDTLISHGVTRFLYEKFYTHSDFYNQAMCRCGEEAILNNKENLYKCNYCGDNADIVIIPTSVTSKLFFHETRSTGVKAKRIPRPFTYQITDTPDRKYSQVDTYDTNTIKTLMNMADEMVDDAAASVDTSE